MGLVLYERQGHVAIVTMNRPTKLNALNVEMIEAMAEAWERLRLDSEARVAVLTGAGTGFCVGLDMRDIAEGRLRHSVLTTKGPNRFSPRVQSKPVVGAVNGAAIGAGLDFVAMECDIIVAAQGASFGMPEVHVGMASLGAPFAAARLPRAVVMEMFLTGEPITAQRACEIGLINHVVPPGEVLPAALAIAKKIAQNAPNAVQQSRQNLLDACDAPPDARASETMAAVRPEIQDSAARGVQAFVRKQRVDW